MIQYKPKYKVQETYLNNYFSNIIIIDLKLKKIKTPLSHELIVS